MTIGRASPMRGALDSLRAGEALLLVHSALRSLRSHEDSARRFAFARRQVLQRLIPELGDPEALAGAVAGAARNGLGYADVRALADRVASLTLGEAREQVDTVFHESGALDLASGASGLCARQRSSTSSRSPRSCTTNWTDRLC